MLIVLVACQWDEWNEWDSSQCAAPCAGKKETRNRIKKTFNGQDCSGDDKEERQCSVQDCKGKQGVLYVTNILFRTQL